MRAALTDPDDAFLLTEVPDPTPGATDLVLRVTGCGICGSDLKAHPAMPGGTVMGHELAGDVVAVGTAVDGWREGDRAAVLPVFSCGSCAHCRAGDVAHCTESVLVGLGGAPGGFADLVRVSADLSFALPPDVPTEWGPLVEPFAVGLHTARAAAVSDGDRVLVIGGGAVGLTTAAWARHLGAASVTVSDPSPRRRDAAIEAGADAVVDPTADELGGPFDVVVECVGRPGLLDAAVGAADVHGRVVVAGVCAELDPFLPLVALMKEVSIRFSVYYRPEEFRTVVDAFASGSIDPSPLLTRTVGLADLATTFTALTSSTDDVKIVVDPTR